jgi:transposase InsO family protein
LVDELIVLTQEEIMETTKSVSRRPRKNYKIEFKQQAVEFFQKGNTYTATCEKFDIPSNGTLRNWLKKYEKEGLEGLSQKSRRPHYQPRKTSQWVIDKILALKKERPEMGSQAMSGHLKRFESVDLSSRSIGKVFKKHNIVDGDAGLAECRYHVKGDKDKKLENTLEAELGEWERFSRPHPNDLWQMDIMSFYIRDHHKVYLISILDDCSRKIVNWGLFRKQTADNVLEVLRGALRKHGCPKEVLTDQGAQFKHWKGVTQFENILSKLKVEHIKARSHHPQTCGKIERFHGTIHRELIDKEFFLSQEQAVERIARFIEHYNFARPHSALNGFTPSDRYFNVIDAVKKYLEDTKQAKNETEEKEESFCFGSQSKIYMVGKILGNDIRVQEIAGNISVHLNNQLFKEINLLASSLK